MTQQQQTPPQTPPQTRREQSISLDADLIADARERGAAQQLSAAQQLEQWARLGRALDDNPDLPVAFVKKCLQADRSLMQGNLTALLSQAQARRR